MLTLNETMAIVQPCLQSKTGLAGLSPQQIGAFIQALKFYSEEGTLKLGTDQFDKLADCLSNRQIESAGIKGKLSPKKLQEKGVTASVPAKASEAANKFWFEPRYDSEQDVWYVSKCERDGDGKNCEVAVEENLPTEKDAVLKAWEHMKKAKTDKHTESETDCWLQGANGQYLMESPTHKILKGELELTPSAQAIFNELPIVKLLTELDNQLVPGDIFKGPKYNGLVLAKDKIDQDGFYWVPCDGAGELNPAQLRVAHSNLLLDGKVEKIGHKDLVKHEAEGFEWYDSGNEKVDNEQMPHLDQRWALFNKLAPKKFQDLYSKQEDINYHAENALMIALFCDWIAEGHKPEDFTMDESELENLTQTKSSTEALAAASDIREALAEVFHEAWEHWSKAVKDDIKTPERIARWQEYWVPYDQLDESTKDMDREWADEAMGRIDKFIKEGKQAKEMVTRVVETAQDDEEWKQDLALTLLSEAVSSLIDDRDNWTPHEMGESPMFTGSPDAEKWLREITGPQMEVTETVPAHGEEVGVDWSKFLPYKLVDEMEAAVNDKWKGKATLAELYAEYPRGAAHLVLQLLGHGVSLTDDKEGEEWLEKKGMDPKEGDRDMGYFESAYDEGINYIQALLDAYDEQHPIDKDDAEASLEKFPRADVLAGAFKEMAIEEDEDKIAFIKENLERVRAKRDKIQEEMDHMLSEMYEVPKHMEMDWRDYNSIEQEYEAELKKLGAA